MSKNSKIFKIGIAVALGLAIILSVIGIVQYLNNKETNENKTYADTLDEYSLVEDSGEKILLIPKDEVTSFSMTDSNGILLAFEKEGDEWVYVDDPSLDMNEDRIDKVLNYIMDISFVDTIDAIDGTDYNLDQNSPMYIVNDSNGNPTIISLGDTTDDGKIYFALNYDFTKIFVNSGKLGKVLEYKVEDLVALN